MATSPINTIKAAPGMVRAQSASPKPKASEGTGSKESKADPSPPSSSKTIDVASASASSQAHILNSPRDAEVPPPKQTPPKFPAPNKPLPTIPTKNKSKLHKAYNKKVDTSSLEHLQKFLQWTDRLPLGKLSFL